MKRLQKNLIITYSNQRVRDLRTQGATQPLDKVITLKNLISELFTANNIKTVIDSTLASAIVYKLIEQEKIAYFSYIEHGAKSLETIVDFFIKSARNQVSFEQFHKGEKLQALNVLYKAYEAFKKQNNLVDSADVEREVCANWQHYFNEKEYGEIFIDTFEVGDLFFIESLWQEKIYKNLSCYKSLTLPAPSTGHATLIKPKEAVFDAVDEVKTAIKIARKLMQEGSSDREILIVATDIEEYAPLYKLFLQEYAMQGYSSIGTPLSAYMGNTKKIKEELEQFKNRVKNLKLQFQSLGLSWSVSYEQQLKNSLQILDEKVGVELTEPNQIVGLHKHYKHIIFIGADMNHFPPKPTNNFLYTYEQSLEYFYANDYFISSKTQYEYLKTITDNLYIITASYSGKRELVPSIIIDTNITKTIDTSDIQSLHDIAHTNQTITPDSATQAFYTSLISNEFTKYDGLHVKGMEAHHLSASQLNRYLTCPLQYLYLNKLKIQSPKETQEGFDVMEEGTLMHRCFELFGLHVKQNKLTTTNKDELYELMFDYSNQAHQEMMQNTTENIYHKIALQHLQAGLIDNKEDGVLARFVEYYITNAKELQYFQKSEFEKEFQLDENLKPTQEEEYFIKGFIDRLDETDKSVRIIDYKSKKTQAKIDQEKMQQIRELKDVQLPLYMLWAAQTYPNKTHSAHLLSFKGKYNATHFANMSNEEEKDVVVYDSEYEEKLKNTIYEVKQKIEAGAFAFDNSDAKACEWCDVKFLCYGGMVEKINSATKL